MGLRQNSLKVHLSVRGHLRKTGLFTSAMFSNEKKKNEFIRVELIHLKLQGRMRNFSVKKTGGNHSSSFVVNAPNGCTR